jgi:SAM-dependent methyltransferase
MGFSSGQGFWTEQVVPRITNTMCGGRALHARRRQATEGLSGTVVEIGFGSGSNVPFYPLDVTRVLAIEPSPVARRLAASRVAASPVPIDFAGLDGEQLPLPDASVDAALSTFTLCTIPDVARALAELRRVLRPGGELHFLEHGLARDPGVVRWQHRLDGLQQHVCAGCHLDRPIDRLVHGAGFVFAELDEDEMPGPAFAAPWGHLYVGVARVPD